VDLSRPTTFNTIKLLKENPGFEFFDNKSTPEKEDARKIVQQAFSLGVSDIERWKLANSNIKAGWGYYKGSYIGHLMRIPALGEPVLTGGNHDIVNAHTRTHGPSWRMIVSLEKSGAKMWGVYPGGQSGNPGSDHYVDMLDTWVQGKYFPIHFFRKADDAGEASDKTQLNPQKGI
jgi:penicillin amidase